MARSRAVPQSLEIVRAALKERGMLASEEQEEYFDLDPHELEWYALKGLRKQDVNSNLLTE
jgi:hypothetical protein